MILTELGLTFERDGADWRCRELPRLRALGNGAYQVAGQMELIKDLPSAVNEARRLLPGSGLARSKDGGR